jgi:hypothetical protein
VNWTRTELRDVGEERERLSVKVYAFWAEYRDSGADSALVRLEASIFRWYPCYIKNISTIHV